jgi:hypothetical protein
MYIFFYKIYLQWIYWTLFFIARCSRIFASELPSQACFIPSTTIIIASIICLVPHNIQTNTTNISLEAIRRLEACECFVDHTLWLYLLPHKSRHEERAFRVRTCSLSARGWISSCSTPLKLQTFIYELKENKYVMLNCNKVDEANWIPPTFWNHLANGFVH